jgi:hypothetical protein
MLYEEINNKNLKQYEYVSGVYCIHNTVTNKYYIGSSENLKNRLADHFNNSNRNKLIKNDYISQNGKGFTSYLMEKVSIVDDIRLYEQLYIDYFLEQNKELYNIKNETNQKGNVKKHLDLANKLKEILILKSELQLHINKNNYMNVIDNINIKNKPFSTPVYKKLKNLYTYYPVIRESVYKYIDETYSNSNNILISGEVSCYKNDDWFNIFRLCYKVNDHQYLILNTDLYNLNKLQKENNLNLFDTVYNLIKGNIKGIEIHSPYFSKYPLKEYK